jgi:hypothetical protein
MFFLSRNPDLSSLRNLLGESNVPLGQLNILRKDFLGLVEKDLYAFMRHCCDR